MGFLLAFFIKKLPGREGFFLPSFYFAMVHQRKSVIIFGTRQKKPDGKSHPVLKESTRVKMGDLLAPEVLQFGFLGRDFVFRIVHQHLP